MLKPLFERVLELTGWLETARFSPACYGVSVGNFDGAGMSFGIVQFNLLSRTLQPLLGQMLADYPELVAFCFGELLPELNDMLATKSTKYQIKWANQRTVKGGALLSMWRDSFRKLGLMPQCIVLQKEMAREKYYSPAVKLCHEYELWSERGLALMFDITVQNGSINRATKTLIREDIKQLDPGLKIGELEVAKLLIIAKRRSEASTAKWIELVRRRKLLIAKGVGIYNGVELDLAADFQLRLAPIVI